MLIKEERETKKRRWKEREDNYQKVMNVMHRTEIRRYGGENQCPWVGPSICSKEVTWDLNDKKEEAIEVQGKVISARGTAKTLRWEWVLGVHRTEKSQYGLSRSVRGSYTRWCHREGRSQVTQGFVSWDWIHSSSICSMNKCTGLWNTMGM